MNVWKFFLLSLPFLIPLVTQAKLFTNTYVSFELPPNWSCKITESEWVCGSQIKDKSSQAIIILTAKERGPADTLASYKAHLGRPKSVLQKGSSVMRSAKVLHVKERSIANQVWVDGIHQGSEVPNFYTRYLATVKGRLAIILTFSAHKKHYTKYSHDFLKTIESIRVVASEKLLSDKRPSDHHQINNQQEWFPVNIPNQIKTIEPLPDGAPEKNKSSDIILAAILLLGATGFYFFIKKRGKKS